MTSPDVRTAGRQLRRQARGFTLVELVAVLAVVGIMAGVAVPALGSMRGMRGRVAARQLHRDLTHARHRAMATGAATWVTFDIPAASWTLLSDDPTNPGFVNAVILEDAATGQAYTLSLGGPEYPGIGLTDCDFDGGVTIGFDWLGQPMKHDGSPLAADGVVTLTDDHQVRVNAVTGLLTLENS